MRNKSLSRHHPDRAESGKHAEQASRKLALAPFFVSARTHEIGVRLALGATSREIVGLFARQSARQVLGGVLLGSAGAIAVARVLRGSLYGVSATDPLTSLAVVLVLASVAAIATVLPALRATRVDSVRVLQ